MSAAVAVDPVLEEEFRAVASQLGEAFLALEAAQLKVSQLKVQRLDVLKRNQEDLQRRSKAVDVDPVKSPQGQPSEVV